MTESPIPSKPAKWKRPLIGGLLSALPAILFGLIIIVELSSPQTLQALYSLRSWEYSRHSSWFLELCLPKHARPWQLY